MAVFTFPLISILSIFLSSLPSENSFPFNQISIKKRLSCIFKQDKRLSNKCFRLSASIPYFHRPTSLPTTFLSVFFLFEYAKQMLCFVLSNTAFFMHSWYKLLCKLTNILFPFPGPHYWDPVTFSLFFLQLNDYCTLFLYRTLSQKTLVIHISIFSYSVLSRKNAWKKSAQK